MNNSFASVHPKLVCEWSEKNLPLTPDKITFGSNKIMWWKGSCGHEWQASVKSRSVGEKCPICSGARVVEGINDLQTLKPKIAAEWSDKNGDLKPTMVSVGSHKKVIWKGKCGHEWTASVKSRTINGTGCPYCSHNTILEGFNDLATVCPDVAAEWSEKNLPLATLPVRGDRQTLNSDLAELSVRATITRRLIFIALLRRELLTHLRNLVRDYYYFKDLQSAVALKLTAELKVSFPAYAKVFSKVTTQSSLKLLSSYPLPENMLAVSKEDIVDIIRSTARFGEAYACVSMTPLSLPHRMPLFSAGLFLAMLFASVFISTLIRNTRSIWTRS